MGKYLKNYSDEIRKIFNNAVLTSYQDDELKKCLNNIKPYLKDVFEDMYKLFINDFSCNEIGKIYAKNERTIQYVFKKLGLQRNAYEAQRIAVKKRDYVSIRKTCKKTMLDRLPETQLSGSFIENVVRHDIGLLLQNTLSDEYEIIVGINTMTSAGELDIPIIILHNKKIYKFGIEVNGIFFHEGKNIVYKDSNKQTNLEKLGYRTFKIETKAYYRKNSVHNVKYYSELKDKISDICNKISEITLNN